MAQPNRPISSTDAKGANNKLGNYRVLVWSTAIIVIVFAAFLYLFVKGTPRGIEGIPGKATDGGAMMAPKPAAPDGGAMMAPKPAAPDGGAMMAPKPAAPAPAPAQPPATNP